MIAVIWRSPTTRLPSGGYKRSPVAAATLGQKRLSGALAELSTLGALYLQVMRGILVWEESANLRVSNAIQDGDLAMPVAALVGLGGREVDAAPLHNAQRLDI